MERPNHNDEVMDGMPKLYAVSKTVYRSTNSGAFVPKLELRIERGPSAKAVEKLLLNEALTLFPKTQGWRGHKVKAMRICREHVDYLIGFEEQL